MTRPQRLSAIKIFAERLGGRKMRVLEIIGEGIEIYGVNLEEDRNPEVTERCKICGTFFSTDCGECLYNAEDDRMFFKISASEMTAEKMIEAVKGFTIRHFLEKEHLGQGNDVHDAPENMIVLRDNQDHFEGSVDSYSPEKLGLSSIWQTPQVQYLGIRVEDIENGTVKKIIRSSHSGKSEVIFDFLKGTVEGRVSDNFVRNDLGV